MADTAASLALSARRNEVARFTIAVTGIDMTGVAMAMQIRLGLDVPGAPLISLATVTTLAAEGLKLDSVTTTNGVPTSIIKGRINASTMTDATKVPYMGEIGADSVLAYAMQWTLNGDAQTRLYGDFIVVASAFGSDGAPTNRPPSYGGTQSFSARSSGGSLSFGDQIVSVTIAGAELLSPLVAQTTLAAASSQQSAGAALESAAYAEEFSGPAYDTVAAGQTATTAGQFFRVSNGDTPRTYTRYQRTAGGSVVAAALATSAQLAAPTGAALVGLPQGGHVSDAITGLTPQMKGAIGDGVANDMMPFINCLLTRRQINLDGVYKLPNALRVLNAKLNIYKEIDSGVICSQQGNQIVYVVDVAAGTVTTQMQGNDSTTLEFVNCTGKMDIQLSDTRDTQPGVSVSLLLRSCNNMEVKARVDGGKDIAIAAVESDNCTIRSQVIGTVANRTGNGIFLIGCANTWVKNSLIYYCDFGGAIIGPGYGSGNRADLMSSRPYQQTMNSGFRESLVLDHTGHAFDMNGAVACGFESLIASSYTGPTNKGNPAIQVKQSNNAPGVTGPGGDAGPDFAFANWVSHCVTFDQVCGFSAQEGALVKFSHNTAIRSKRNAMFLNSTHGCRVIDFTAVDWGLDIVTWPLLNGETDCGAISVFAGSDRVTINGLTLSIRDTSNPNINRLSYVNIAASAVSLDDVQFDRAGFMTSAFTTSGSNQLTPVTGSLAVGQNISGAGIPAGTTITALSGTTATMSNNATITSGAAVTITQQLSRALNITASSARLGIGIRVEASTNFVNHPINDTQNSTIYPLEYTVLVNLAATGAYYLPAVPSRGFVPGVVATLNVVAPAGSPQYQVGRVGSTGAFVATRAAPASGAVETIVPVTGGVSGASVALLVTVTTAGTAGQQLTTVRGIPQQ